MSIKDLFGKTSKNLEETVQDVESEKFVEEKSKQQDRYLPPIDFSDPENFVYYGSAELYYDAAIRRIYEDYPYDGSKAEQIEFEEKSSNLERWLFENKYPKTTGYVELGTTGNTSPVPSSPWASTTINEYIRVWGGLHTDDSTELQDKFLKSAKYDDDKNRNQNWNCDFTKGITVEFWLKKDSFDPGNQPREVVLDLWNNETDTTSADYGRVIFALGGVTSTTAHVHLTLMDTTIQLTSTALDFSSWHHYAFSVIKQSSDLLVRLYVDGDEILEQTFTPTTTPDEIGGRIDGFIGALQFEDANGDGAKGYGKLSAYLDEFRFWKTERTARQIKLNWFSQVGGGANTDDATTDLGVYFKFNEGIVGNTITDSVVLDYSGRLANGLWIGYPGSSVRNTGSAIEAVGYTEPATPIIYSSHPDVASLASEMQTSGSSYDSERGQAFFNSMPTWLQQEDNGNLRQISQILASYMDTLHVQIKQMTELRNKEYTPEGLKPSTMSMDLLKDKGFMVENLFGMNEVYEKLSDLDIQDNQFENDISEIKNTIYTNIYNNLEKIYKTKGTEASIRNFIRCFGIDDELIKLNLYTDGGVQYLSDKSRVTSVKKKYINLNNSDYFSSTIYQTSSADNTNTFISGSSASTNASNNAFTLEADIVVPHKIKKQENGYFGTPFLSSSVFGFHAAIPNVPHDYTWYGESTPTATAEGLIQFDITQHTSWTGGTFTLISTDGTERTYIFDPTAINGSLDSEGRVQITIGTFPYQTANNIVSAIQSANGHLGKITATYTYNNLSLFQVQAGVEGNTVITQTGLAAYFTITNFYDGASTIDSLVDLQVHLVRDSVESDHAKFVLKNEEGTIYQESAYVYDIYDNEHYNIAIRIKPQTYPYAGGVTNTTPDYDIEMYATTNNLGETKEEILLSQTVDYATGSVYMNVAKRVYAGAHIQNFTGSVQERTDVEIGSIRAWLDYLDDDEIKKHNKDVLNYGLHRSIDGSNLYTVDNKQIPTHDLTILNWDFDTVLASDGSGQFIVEDITSGSTDTIYGWVDDVIRREHRARGDFFPTEDSSFLSNEFLYSLKKQLPETAYNSENIFIKGEQEINFSDDDDVSDNLFVLEKSPANLVSEEMLKSFSTTMEFANLVGRPIDRYRLEYKDLAKARELFFNRVESDLDFDRFFEYFKWIDSSISSMVNQLIPLSANFAGGIVDVIEPHILERDKYQRQIGLLNTVTSTEASIRGVQELNYNWKFGHAPVSGDEADNCLWQKERKEREEQTREEIRQVLARQNNQEFTNPVNLSGSNGIYEGRTYATRRFSRPVKLDIGLNNSIHAGINYKKGKDRDFLRTVITPHGELGPSSGAPKNIMTIGAGDGHGLNGVVDCNDEQRPNELKKLDGFAQVGKFSSFAPATLLEPLDDSLHYLFKRKLSTVFPGNFVSSSVNTGYSARINKSGASNGFKEGVNVVNLHSDTTDITNEIPMQGPFTNQWIGGQQVRHVSVAKAPETQETRPELWRLLVGQNPLQDPGDTDGAMGFTGPDYGAPYPLSENQWAIYYREERAKRPVNIKNIKTVLGTGSAGNYIRGYEVFSTFGDQGYFLKRAGNLLPQVISDELPQTTNYLTLVAQRASDAGNVFTSETNRWGDVQEISATLSFIYTNNETGNTPANCSGLRITVERANSDSITFALDNSVGVVSGDLDGGGYTIIATDGRTWPQMITEFQTAFTDPTNGFGSNVSIAGVYSNPVPSNEILNFTVTEESLVGSEGNGGSLSLDTSPYLSTSSTQFDGGVSSNITITETQDRSTGSINAIRTRFSAPGGPEINSSGYLDVATQQYSVHNSINFRNLSVRASGSGEQGTIRVDSHAGRREGLRTLRTRHQGQFGIDSQHGVVSATDYVAEASFHKQHRNRGKRAESEAREILGPIIGKQTPNTLRLRNIKGKIEETKTVVVSCWAKFNSASSEPENRYFFKDPEGIAAYIIAGTANLRLSINAGGLSIGTNVDLLSTSISGAINQWNHYIFVYRIIGTELYLRLYINGTHELNFKNPSILPTFSCSFDNELFIMSGGGTSEEMQGQMVNFSYLEGESENISQEIIDALYKDSDGSATLGLPGFRNFWYLDCGPFLSDGDSIPDDFIFHSLSKEFCDKIYVEGEDYEADLSGFSGSFASFGYKFDNLNVNSLLPQSDFQYSWINSAISGSNWEDEQKVLGFAPSNGLITTCLGQEPALKFPTISSLYGE